MKLYQIILPVLIGALIGYCTNYVAIKMLFLPRRALHIGKWRLPMTPGVIPKNKARLATAVGNAVSDRLITRQDSNYTASLDIQAAIGQGNTVITPVQMATYAATIANKGVRYRTHLVKALVDTNTGEVVQEIEPEIVEVIEDEIGAFDLVEEGMVRACELVSYVNTYPYTLAIKTGTPQRSEYYMVGNTRKYYCNTMMIAYGPVEDAQIAIGIVFEYGSAGAKAGELVTQIFDAYFFEQSGSMTPETENTLLH